jgi:hypothetical protein
MRKLLSIAGILMGEAVRALLNWNKTSEARRVPVEQNLPRPASGWDYRPKEVIRRCAAVQSAGTDTTDLPTSSVAKEKGDNVWFDERWLEFGAATFANADSVGATVEDGTIKASLSDQERAVSAYD